MILSLVLLVGYAGEVSLATMALAGIGATVLYHQVGHDSTSRAGPMAYVIAMAVTALVGAVMAIPALRLRGLYLALATAAFSLGVEQMLFKEFSARRRIYPATLLLLVAAGVIATVGSARARGGRSAGVVAAASAAVISLAATNPWLQREQWSPIFPNGNLNLPRPRLLGVDFTSQTNFLLLLTTVFAVLGVGLITLRRSSFGRQLAALKDSPAACATLGLNVVRLKLSVFMISAAMAGLGGSLFAQEIGSVTADRFSLFESMSMLMLLVVAGAGYVSGGLAAGLLYGAVFVTMQAVLAKLGTDYSAFRGPFAWLAQFTTVLPALIGIGLGRNPSGFLNQSFAVWEATIHRVRPVFVAGIGVELALWSLTFQHVIGNWAFALLTLALLVALPRVAVAVRPAAFAPAAPRQPTIPLERLGLDRPFTPEDRARVDAGLDLGQAVR